MGFLATLGTAITPGLGTAIGAGLGLIGGLFANRTNRNIANQNLAYQQQANAANIAFQKEENAITREREDNAYQRAALDLQRAGLSKTLAAGHPASSAALPAPNQQALNNQFRYESALQKLDLARTLQDMIVSRETIKQNWKHVENETNLTDAKISNLMAQSGLYNSETELNKIVGEKKGAQIQSEIDYTVQKIAESKNVMNLNNEKILQMSYEIAHTIAQTENLGFQSEMLLNQIVGQKLTNLTNSWNLSRNMMYGTPTNYTPGAVGKLARDVSGSWNSLIFGNGYYSNALDTIMGSY